MNEGTRKTSATGLLGGSFDPIHNGHLYLAEQARSSVPLDRVIFIPALNPPHKTSRNLTDHAHRLAMIRLAIGHLAWLSVDDIEIRRGGVSYTVDTVRAMAGAWPDSALYFIIGSDSLTELWTWRRISEIAAKVTFLTLRRDKDESPVPGPELEAQLEGTPFRSILLSAPPVPVSSTAIRRRIKKGLSIAEYVPAPVAEYIERHRLYGDA